MEEEFNQVDAKEIIVYKLVYPDKETALNDLISKGIIDEERLYINGTHSVVYYQDEFTINVDVMTEKVFIFENEVFPVSPDHQFSGWEKQEDNNIIEETNV